MRPLLLMALLLSSACSALPQKSVVAIPAPPAAVRALRTVYLPVEVGQDRLNQCLRAQREQSKATSKWRKYADKLERLLGITREQDND